MTANTISPNTSRPWLLVWLGLEPKSKSSVLLNLPTIIKPVNHGNLTLNLILRSPLFSATSISSDLCQQKKNSGDYNSFLWGFKKPTSGKIERLRKQMELEHAPFSLRICTVPRSQRMLRNFPVFEHFKQFCSAGVGGCSTSPTCTEKEMPTELESSLIPAILNKTAHSANETGNYE